MKFYASLAGQQFEAIYNFSSSASPRPQWCEESSYRVAKTWHEADTDIYVLVPHYEPLEHFNSILYQGVGNGFFRRWGLVDFEAVRLPIEFVGGKLATTMIETGRGYKILFK